MGIATRGRSTYTVEVIMIQVPVVNSSFLVQGSSGLVGTGGVERFECVFTPIHVFEAAHCQLQKT